MIPSVYDCIARYQSAGRLNSACTLKALHIKSETEAARRSAAASVQLAVDACVLVHEQIAVLLKGADPDHNVADYVAMATNNAVHHWSCEGKVPEGLNFVEECVKSYIIECVRQNVDNPKWHGENWSRKVGCLAREAGYPAERVASLTEALPYFIPDLFVGFSRISDEELTTQILDFWEEECSDREG